MEKTTMVPPHLCASPARIKSHHKESNHLVVFEDNMLSYVAVPPLPSSSLIDPIGLCFSDHDDEWDLRAEQCCLSEPGHVHAHYHHKEKREDILLKQCMEEAGCALPMSLDLPISLFTDVSHDQEHEHKDGCGHNQIAHGDHFDWLIPTIDGSFLLSHVQMTDSGVSRFIEHGRLVKVGESLGRLKRNTRQILQLFGYESPKKNGYEMLLPVEEIVKDECLKSNENENNPVCALLSPDLSHSSDGEDMVKVDLPSNLTNHIVVKTTLDVFGICCPAEVPLIRKILEPLPGVKEVSVNVASKMVTVLHDSDLTPEGKLVKVLNEARMDASIRYHGELKSTHRWPSPYTIASGLLMAVAFFQYVFHPLKWVALGAVAAGLPPIILRSVVSLRRMVLDINALMVIAVGGSIALGDYLEAGSIVFLFTLADWLESRSSDKARLAISAVMNLAPQTAVLASGSKVPVSEVKVGSKIVVKAGESIPIDGKVISGNSSVDESSLTGESIPVEKAVGSIVWAGTMNMSGFLCVETTALAEDSAVARMVRLVEDAQTQRSHTEQLVERFAKYYTPFVVVTAIAVAVIPLALHAHNIRHWLYLALVLLVVACPCALVISTPVTTTCGIAQAARAGLVIKGGSFLEVLGKLQVIALDKTGTLTEGHFRVAEVLTLEETVSVEQLLYWICCVENKASHPMASALVAYARLHGIEPSGNVDGFEIIPGEGVSGTIDGHQIHIGNSRLATRLHWFEALNTSVVEKWSNDGATVCWVGVNERAVGIFSVTDQVRPEAEEAIHDLKNLGIHVAMLTGDSEAAADSVQHLIGEMDVFSQLLPEDKVRILKELKESGITGMVGDGINDAPALAAADVGIAMGVAGSAVAMETADIALMTNDLRKVAAAVKLGQSARTKIQQNVLLAVLTKALIIVLAAVGYASLWAAVLADVGTCLVVVFNSMLLLKRKKIRRSQTAGHHHCQSEECKSHEHCHQKHDHHNHGHFHQDHGHSHQHHGHYCGLMKIFHCGHSHRRKSFSDGGDCCTESVAAKHADTSPCCKFGRDVHHRHYHQHTEKGGKICSSLMLSKLVKLDCCSKLSLTAYPDASPCCNSGKNAHHKHHHHQKLKDERDGHLMPTLEKPVDGVREEFIVEIDSPHSCCGTPASSQCCNSVHSNDFITVKPCCEVGGKSMSSGIRRRLGHKETCAKDCQEVNCIAVVGTPDRTGSSIPFSNRGYEPNHHAAASPCLHSVEVGSHSSEQSCCQTEMNSVNPGDLSHCGTCTKACLARDRISSVSMHDGKDSCINIASKNERQQVSIKTGPTNNLTSQEKLVLDTEADINQCCSKSGHDYCHSFHEGEPDLAPRHQKT